MPQQCCPAAGARSSSVSLVPAAAAVPPFVRVGPARWAGRHSGLNTISRVAAKPSSRSPLPPSQKPCLESLLIRRSAARLEAFQPRKTPQTRKPSGNATVAKGCAHSL